MTGEDSKRLAQIRADTEKWQALDPSAKYWDVPFLLRIMDERINNERRVRQ